VVANRLLLLAQRYPALDPQKPTDAQAIVVLGGGGVRNSAAEYGGAAMAEPSLLERLTLAAFLAHRYSLPVAVSGAPEAFAMSAPVTGTWGLTPKWIEDGSRDPFENARLSARVLFPAGIRRIILVTTSAHEWRAAHEFMAAGFSVTPAPAGVLGDV